MRTVLLTGGSEIVATALLEELHQAGEPLAVVALGIDSMLRDVLPDCPYARIDWPPTQPARTVQALLAQLQAWGASAQQPWNILPTEDSGLRLLLEFQEDFLSIGRFGRARKLRLGGLDKAELFAYLAQNGCADVAAETVAVRTVAEALVEVARMNGDCVIKPALKPYSMDLGALGAKAVLARDYRDVRQLEATLAQAWPLAEEWVVQQRLFSPQDNEPVLWMLRNEDGATSAIAGRVRWKYPRMGGTGCWVETVECVADDLLDKGLRIMEALDVVGMCELEFLPDAAGELRILEVNPRPWLQVGLPAAAGYPMARELVAVLRGAAPRPVAYRPHASWVNVERLLAAALSGQQGGRLQSLLTAWRATANAATIAVYGTRLPRVRWRWLGRMCRRIGF